MASKRVGKVAVTGVGNHEAGWEPTAADVPSQAQAEFEASVRLQKLKPTQADMRAAFGEPIDEGKSVRWSIDRRNDPKAFAKWKEISTPHRRAETERSMHWNNSHRKVQVVDPKTGRRELIFEEHEDRIGRRRGLRRDRPFASMPQIVAGPDGMLFRYLKSGGWYPTGRTCLGTPLDGSDPTALSPQRDPDGETWCDFDGDWRRVVLNFDNDECTLEFVKE